MTSDIRAVALALGGDIVGRDSVIAPGPGHSHKDRSLSVKLSPQGPEGFIVFSHAGDDFAACREHVRARLGLERSDRRATAERFFTPKPKPALQADDNNHRVAMRIWKDAVDPRGTLAERYLNGRHLEVPDDVANEAVRFHPRLAFGGEFVAGMVTLYRCIFTNEPRAISRTFLDHEGNKLERKMLGPVRNAAIKVDADEEVSQGLHIGEGFETCLAARHTGLRPVWALGSASAIAAFPVLPGIDAVTILAERDASGTGERAAKACYERWLAASRDAFIAMPRVGSDLADAWKASA